MKNTHPSLTDIDRRFFPTRHRHQLPGISHSKFLSPEELDDLYSANDDEEEEEEEDNDNNNNNNDLLNRICKREIFSTIHSLLTDSHRYQQFSKASLSNNLCLFYVPCMNISVNNHAIRVSLKEDCKVETNRTVFFDDMETSVIDGLKLWSTPFNCAPYTIRIAPWRIGQQQRRPVRCYMGDESCGKNIISTLPIFKDDFNTVSEEDGTELGCSMLLSISHAIQMSPPMRLKFETNAAAILRNYGCKEKKKNKIPEWLEDLASRPSLPKPVLTDTSTRDFGALGTMYVNMGVNIGHALVDYDCTPRISGVASALTESVFYVARGVCTRASALSWESIKTVVRNNKKFLFTEGDDRFKTIETKKKKKNNNNNCSALFDVPYVVTSHPSDLFNDYIFYSRILKRATLLGRGGMHPVGWCMFLADPIRYPSRLVSRQKHLKGVVDNAGVATILRTGVPCRKFNRDLALKNGDLMSVKMEKSNNSCIAMEKSLYFLIDGRILLGGQVDGLTIEMDTMVKNKITVEKHLVYSLCVSPSLTGDMVSVAMEGSAAIRGLAVLEYTQRLWDAGKRDVHEKEFWSDGITTADDHRRRHQRQSDNNDDDDCSYAKLKPPGIWCTDDDYIFLDMLYSIARIPLDRYKTNVEINNQRAVIRCYRALVDQNTGSPVPHLLYVFRMIMNFCGFVHIITTMDGVKTHHLLYDAAIIGINMAKKIITILVGTRGNNAKSTLARTFEECLWSMVANVSIKSFNESCGSVSSTQANLAGVLGKKMVAVCDEVGYQGGEKYRTEEADHGLWNQLKEGTRKSKILQCAHLAKTTAATAASSSSSATADNNPIVQTDESSPLPRLPSLSSSPPPILVPPPPTAAALSSSPLPRHLRCNRKIFLTDVAWWNKNDDTVLEKLNPRNMIAFCLSRGIVPFAGVKDLKKDANKHHETREHMTRFLVQNADAILDYELPREQKILRFLSSSLGLEVDANICQAIKTVLLTTPSNRGDVLTEISSQYDDIWEEFDREKIRQALNDPEENEEEDGVTIAVEELCDHHHHHDLYYADAIVDDDNASKHDTTKSIIDKTCIGHLILKDGLTKEDDTTTTMALIKNTNRLLQNEIEIKTKRIIDEIRDSRGASLDGVAYELCSFRSFVVSNGKMIIGNTESWRRSITLLMRLLRSTGSVRRCLAAHLEETTTAADADTDDDCCLISLRDLLEWNSNSTNSNDSCGVLYAMHLFITESGRGKRNRMNENATIKAAFKSHDDDDDKSGMAMSSLDVNPRKGVEEFIVSLFFDPLLYTGSTKLSLSNTKAVKLDRNTTQLILNDVTKISADSGKHQQQQQHPLLLQLLQNRMKMTNEQNLLALNNDSDSEKIFNEKSHTKKRGTQVGKGISSYLLNPMVAPLVRQIRDYACSTTTARNEYNVNSKGEDGGGGGGGASNKLLSGQFSCNMIKRVVSTMATVHTRDLFESSKEVIATIALFFMSNSYTFQFGLDAAMLKRILFFPCETVLESSNKNVDVSNLTRLIKTGLRTIHSRLIRRRVMISSSSSSSSSACDDDSDDALDEDEATREWNRTLCDALHMNNDGSTKRTIFNSVEVPCRVTQHILQHGVYEISDRQKNAGITMAGNTFFTLYYRMILGSFSPSSPSSSLVLMPPPPPPPKKQRSSLSSSPLVTLAVVNGNGDGGRIAASAPPLPQARHHRHFCSLNPKDLKTFSTAIEAARCGSTRRIEEIFKPLLFVMAPFVRGGSSSLAVEGPNITIVREDGGVDSMLCNVYVPNVDRHIFLYAALPPSVSVGTVMYKHLCTVWNSSNVNHLQYSCYHLHVCFELVYRADNQAARLNHLIDNNREEMIEFMIACSVYKNILETMGVMDCFFTKYSDDAESTATIPGGEEETTLLFKKKKKKKTPPPQQQLLVFPIIVANYDIFTLLTLTNLAETTGPDRDFHRLLVHRVVNNMGLELNPKYLCRDCCRIIK